MIYLGIDPGLHGAFARFDPAAATLEIHDMPTYQLTINGSVKHRLDLQGLADMLHFTGPYDLAVCENPNSMPEQGVASSFSFGYTCGATHAILAALSIPHRLVKPAVWKRAMGLTADKDQTRMIASQRLPSFAHLWARKKDDGRAEAALLALYASTLS